MKKSGKIVFIALGVILILIITLMILSRISIRSIYANFEDESSPLEANIQESLNLENFADVSVKGSWDVSIEQSNSFYVDISYHEKMKGRLNVRVHGNELILGFDDSMTVSPADLTARVGMPSLESLDISGVADVSVADFKEEYIQVMIDGAVNIETENSSTEFLDVICDGVGNVDLGGIVAVSANVQLNGAGKISLNMAGGVLKGALNGVGAIRYVGYVSDNQVEVNGLGQLVNDN